MYSRQARYNSHDIAESIQIQMSCANIKKKKFNNNNIISEVSNIATHGGRHNMNTINAKTGIVSTLLKLFSAQYYNLN